MTFFFRSRALARAFAAACLMLYITCSTAGSDGSAGGLQELHRVRGVISTVEAKDGRPIPATTFYVDDHIYFFTEVSWDSTDQPAGKHQLLYKWYKGDQLALSFGDEKTFSTIPYYWSAWVSGGHLGEGHHKAELYVDGQLFDTQTFDIAPGSRAAAPPIPTSAPAPAVVDGELALRDSIKNNGMALLKSGDVGAFDTLADRFRTTKERTPAGVWKLALLYSCLEMSSLTDPSDPEWNRLEDITKRWLKASPNSSAAVVMTAKLLSHRAWAYRGDGNARAVDREDWAPFNRYIKQASKVLKDHQEVAARDPEWDAIRLSLARPLGADSESIITMASEALDREAYYYPIHYQATRALLPKWGGNEALMKRYVELAEDRTKQQEGTQIYARIYLNIARYAQNPLDELNVTGAKLPAMKQSLDELMRAYPDPFIRESARMMTCLAGDYEYYRNLGRRSAAPTELVSWWDTPEWRRQCDDAAYAGTKSLKDSIASAKRIPLRSYVSYFRGFGTDLWNIVFAVCIVSWLLLEATLGGTFRRLFQTGQTVLGSWSDLPKFDPMQYPRTYWISADFPYIPNLVAVLLLVLGPTLIKLTLPLPNFQDSLPLVTLCAAAALAGLLIIVQRLRYRVVLRADSVEVQSLLRGKVLNRQDIAARLRHDESPILQRIPGRILLTGKQDSAQVFVIPPVMNPDHAFWQWVESLPQETTSSRT